MKRSYVIPLRSTFGKKPKYKRTPSAVNAIRTFLKKHMKVSDVKIGKALNDKMWMHGIKNPLPRVSVDAEKKDDVVYVELSGTKYYEPTAEDLKAEMEAAQKAAKSKAKKSSEKDSVKESSEEVVVEESVDSVKPVDK